MPSQIIKIVLEILSIILKVLLCFLPFDILIYLLMICTY